MRTDFRTCLFAAMLVLLLAAPSRQVFGAQSGEWNLEIARQLLAEGWETGDSSRPVILYGVTIVELDHKMFDLFALASSVEVSNEEKLNWQVSSEPALLELAGMYKESKVKAQVQLGKNHSTGLQETTAWFGTTLHKTASVSFRQRAVGSQNQEAYFEFRLTPILADPAGSRVQTEVSLESLSMQGLISKTSLTAWVQEGLTQPIAVIRVGDQQRNGAQQRFFALYLTGHTSELSEMPKADLSNFNRLFHELTGDPFEPAGLTHELSVCARVYEERFGYEAQYTVALPEGLGLALKATGDFSTLPTLMLGVRDALPWSDRVSAYAAFLPVVWDGVKKKLKLGFNYELGIGFRVNSWVLGLAYGQTEEASYYEASVGYVASERFGLSAGLALRKSKPEVFAGAACRF